MFITSAFRSPALVPRYQAWIAANNIIRPNDWIFFQEDDHRKPMWDSGVRKALKIAAADAGCDFPGFGLHSFRREHHHAAGGGW
jgi:hypothetical protein